MILEPVQDHLIGQGSAGDGLVLLRPDVRQGCDQNVARRLGCGRIFQRLDDLGGRGAGLGRQQRSYRAGPCGRLFLDPVLASAILAAASACARSAPGSFGANAASARAIASRVR